MTTRTRAACWIAVVGLWLFGALGPARGEPRGLTVHRITIVDNRFDPSQLTVRAGDVVEWTNRDIVPHTATATDRSWDVGELADGQAGRITVTRTGTVNYRCRYHPHMTGQLTVLARSAK